MDGTDATFVGPSSVSLQNLYNLEHHPSATFFFQIVFSQKYNMSKCERVSCLVVPDSCDSMDCGPPGSSVHGIFQTRILEWFAIPFSRGSFWPRDWTRFPALQEDSLLSEPPGKPLQYAKDNQKQKRSNVLCLGEWSELLNFIKIQLSFYRRITPYFIELKVVVS